MNEGRTGIGQGMQGTPSNSQPISQPSRGIATAPSAWIKAAVARDRNADDAGPAHGGGGAVGAGCR